jgi:nucleoside phosphorylase
MARLWHADVVILTALSKEFDAVVRRLGMTTRAESHSYQQYRTCSINGNVIALPVATGPGQLNAAAATIKVLNDFMPEWLLLIGITGKLKDEIQFGDVLVADQVIDYELGKLLEFDRSQIRQVGYQCSARLIDFAKAVSAGRWATNIAGKRPDGRDGDPKAYIGTMFSGNKVVAAQGFADELRALHPMALGVEMEAAGVTAMLKTTPNPPEFLMIKSAVDKCDRKKSDRWHAYGAEAAARFCHALLKSAVKLAPKPIDYESLKSLVQSRLAAGSQIAFNEAEERMLENYVKRGIEIGARALKDYFEADVSSGGHFLFLAKPVFQSAKMLYATSIDTVSRFWIDPKKRQAAYEYLKQHRDGAHRLFVFHDRESVHLHAKVLDEHAKKYKHVYFCTDTVYEKLLARITPDVTSQMHRDFAILNCSTADRDALYFAELDEDHYTWKAISPDAETAGTISVKTFIGWFNEWRHLKPGEGKGGVFKWRIGAWENEEEWAKTLDGIFGTRTLDVYHMLYVRPGDNSVTIKDVRKMLSDVRRVIDRERESAGRPTLAEKYHIKDIWFGESLAVDAKDGRYGGRLSTGYSGRRNDQPQNFILAMRFDSSEDLERFYRDEKHSEVRQKLYQALDPKVRLVFDKIDEVKNSEGASQRDSVETVSILYESIEDRESSHVNRLDFRSGELTLHMVRHLSPVEFSLPE